MLKFLLLLFFAYSNLASFEAFSHEVRPSFLQLIQINETDFEVIWKVPAKKDYRLALYVAFSEDALVLNEPIDQFRSGAYISRWKIQHPQGLVGTEIHIKGLKSTLTEALVYIERLDGSIQSARLMPDKPRLWIKAVPSPYSTALTYTGLGIKHILAGLDHLLFLLCLLMIAGTGKRIFITITGFTIAHSLTLILSSLNIVKLSVAPVEAIIALSIVYLALEIVRGKSNNLTWRFPITVATSFGLLHGFGFASVLNEIDLPQTELAIGLLFFNLGVEVGQLLFIAAVYLLILFLNILNIKLQQRLINRSLAYGVGALASFWLIERSVGFL